MRSTMYNELGAQVTERGGVAGTHFAVWAPNAREVSVVCDSNSWQRERDSLRSGDNGVWAGFISHIRPGEKYKYSVIDCHGQTLDKADPYAFQAEFRPATASIVCDLSGYSWADDNWMEFRQTTN